MDGPKIDALLVGNYALCAPSASSLEYLDTHAPRARRPKLILLELNTPRLDGWAALRELRSRPETRHIPVVVVSSSDQASDVRECYELGANSVVVKQMSPMSPSAYLVDTVRYWLLMNEAPA